MTPSHSTVEDLQREIEDLRGRLAEAEQANEALTKGQIDAVVVEAHQVPLLLRQAQEALRQSEEQFRAMFEFASVGFALTNPKTGRFLRVNSKLCLITGYSAEELLTQHFSDITHPDDRERDWTLFERMVTTGGSDYQTEKRYVHKDGSIALADVSVTVLRDAKGTPTRSFAMIMDITDRKRAESLREAAYRISEAAQGAGSLQDFFQRAHEIVSTLIPARNFYVALLDPETGMLSFPYFVDEVDPPPAPRPPGRSLTDYVIRTGKPLLASRDVFDDLVARGEVELIGAHSVDWLGVALKAPGGTLGAVVVQTYTAGVRFSDSDRDLLNFISGQLAMAIQRKRVEAELRLQSAALNAAVNAIVISDRDGTIVWINQAFSKLTGYSAEEAIGQNPRALIRSGAHDQAFYKRLWDTLLAGEVWSGEITNRRKNGTLYPEELTITPVKDARGEITHFIAIKRDLTEERHLQAQLLQSQKMDAVGRLAGGVAHDFNNLLTVILGYDDVLLHGLEPGPLLEAAQEVRKAGERAAGLTRQLLAFSRKQTLVSEVLDLGDVVSGLSTMVERLIGEDIKVRVVVSPGLGRVKADRGQLEQVVMNLAVNARDAMPKGGSLIFELQNVELDDAYAATHAEVEPGAYVLLAISDTGTGMDAETQKRIFEPFFTTKEAGKGTGLGLSTAYGIVLQSGGAIDVYSEPGQGTTFKVYLPRVAGDAAVPRALSGINPALAGGSETVLVVEDEAAIRQLTKLILQKAGYTVLVAETPVLAERIAASHPGPIHLMLTDVVMPDMRGPELAERLLRRRPGLRVLYMSGYTDDAIAHHGFLDAGTEFLRKPFTPLGLTQKIREVLGRSEL